MVEIEFLGFHYNAITMKICYRFGFRRVDLPLFINNVFVLFLFDKVEIHYSLQINLGQNSQ